VRDLFRLIARKSKRDDEDRPNRKRLARSEWRQQPGPAAPTGASAGRPSWPASERPWRLDPPTTATAPDGPAAEGATDAGSSPAEEDEPEEPTLLPAA